MFKSRLLLSCLIVPVFAALVGCASFGPPSIARDRFDYTTAVADSWKRQMLLNIVKIRYGDAPIFLDVASIINQYSLEAELRGTFGWSAPPYFDRQEVGATGRYYDRPTITYTPLTGEKFARNLMTPVAPATVMSLVEGGYPVDYVLRLLVHSINGVRNQFGGTARMRKADPEFYTLMEKLRENQNSGTVSLRVKKTEGQNALIMVFRREQNAEIQANVGDVRRLLGLQPDTGEFRVVYGSVPAAPDEIALLTRSIIEVLSDISSTIEVPAEHVAEKRVPPTMEADGTGPRGTLIRILYSKDLPADAFASVPYHDGWFWIDDRDYQSKKLFSFLMFVMTLTETGGKEGAPIVTISAGG